MRAELQPVRRIGLGIASGAQLLYLPWALRLTREADPTRAAVYVHTAIVLASVLLALVFVRMILRQRARDSRHIVWLLPVIALGPLGQIAYLLFSGRTRRGELLAKDRSLL